MMPILTYKTLFLILLFFELTIASVIMGLETWSQVIENLSYQAKLAEMAAQGNINLDIYRFLHSGNASCMSPSIRQELSVNFSPVTPLHQAEWRTSPSTSMPRSLRKNFTDPVTCLMKKPSYLDGNSSYPGVKSRFDDWAAAHIEFDRFNHFTGTFFHWHRYALWVFEQDLRNQCGYTGHLPYWDWGPSVHPQTDSFPVDSQSDHSRTRTGMTAPDPTHSEIFNGDPYSMGSNGAPILTNTSVVFNIPLPTSYLLSLPVPQTNVSTPPGSGTGGGCISPSGPFGTAQAHLGPTLMGAYLNRTPTGTQDAFRYNPRCIVRDLNSYITRHSTSYKNISEAIANYTDLSSFQAIVQSDTRYAFTARNVGLHAGGHVGVGGDPMADKPSSKHPVTYDFILSVVFSLTYAQHRGIPCGSSTTP